MKDLKPSGQVAQVLSQMLTPVWTLGPQSVEPKVSMTKAELLALSAAMVATKELTENFIVYEMIEESATGRRVKL